MMEVSSLVNLCIYLCLNHYGPKMKEQGCGHEKTWRDQCSREVMFKRVALSPEVPRHISSQTPVNLLCRERFHFLQQNVRESWYQKWYQKPSPKPTRNRLTTTEMNLGLRGNSKGEVWGQELAGITEIQRHIPKMRFSCWKDLLDGRSERSSWR